MKKKLKNIQTFEQHTDKNLNISDVSYSFFKLTRNVKHAKHCKDGKDRNILQYFLNDILILEQKYPFDTNYDKGYEHRTDIRDEYLLNSKLYQTRQYEPSCAFWRCCRNKQIGKIRNVKYPISKKILEQFNIPKDYRIELF